MSDHASFTIATRCTALLLAFGLDWLLGELPNNLHPVVWMGRWFTLGERLAPTRKRARLIWGGAWLAAGTGIVWGIAVRVPLAVLVQGAAASLLLAYRALDRAVEQVQLALQQGRLAEARRLLSWHLVSRPTEDLDEKEVAAAALESLAENLSDSVVAPSLCYVLGGLPLLAAYRLANTADAMWGYRNERYEQLGKVAARWDDLLNLAPARATAALIALAAQVLNQRGKQAWRIARRDSGRTASPNAGWPMAAMAGALDTVLTKRDHYRLGDGARMPNALLLAEGRAIVRWAVLLFIGFIAGYGILVGRNSLIGGSL